jgi:hypothetical protein
LDELAAINRDPRDCILVDDARLFGATREPERWPGLVDVIDALREDRPTAHVTVLHDLILSVPAEAKDLVDYFGSRHAEEDWAVGEKARLAGQAAGPAGSRRLVVDVVRARMRRFAHVLGRIRRAGSRGLSRSERG